MQIMGSLLALCARADKGPANFFSDVNYELMGSMVFNKKKYLCDSWIQKIPNMGGSFFDNFNISPWK